MVCVIQAGKEDDCTGQHCRSSFNLPFKLADDRAALEENVGFVKETVLQDCLRHGIPNDGAILKNVTILRELYFVRRSNQTGFVVRTETLDGGFPGNTMFIFGTDCLCLCHSLLHGSYVTVLQFLNVGLSLGDIRTVPAACKRQKRDRDGEQKKMSSEWMEQCSHFPPRFIICLMKFSSEYRFSFQ